MHIAVLGPASLRVLLPNETQLPPGYPFPMTSHLALEYARLGHEVTVITTSPGLLEVLSVDSGAVRVIVVPSRPKARDRAKDMFAKERASILEQIATTNPDVIHAHWTYEFAMAALSSKLPSTVTVHDWAPTILKNLRDPYRLVRLVMQVSVLCRAGSLTAPSSYLANLVSRRYWKQCEVVPNGIRLQHLQVSCLQSKENLRTIGMLNASADSRKNVLAGVEAWALVSAQLSGWTLRLGGSEFAPDGDFADSIRARGLDRQVEFSGRIEPDHVHAWLNETAVFLHPSLEESFGMVLIEALAAGCAVVAGQNSGAVSEVVGPFAFLADVASAEDIASKILSAIETCSPSHLTDADLQKHLARFEIASVARSYERILQLRQEVVSQ